MLHETCLNQFFRTQIEFFFRKIMVSTKIRVSDKTENNYVKMNFNVINVKVVVVVAFVVESLSPLWFSPTPWTVACLCPWDFPGKNTGMGCCFSSPGNLPGPGIQSMSPVWQADSLPLSLLGSLQSLKCLSRSWCNGLYPASVYGISQVGILERVAISSSRGSSWPRDQTCFSCIAGGFFTTREALV